ncbi:MAG TPA: DUF6691 family protein [Solirubrobacteraceae bacterium]|nr:DUF6691 family protein [Solirubrobacteraceae bacterium]
MCSRIAAAVIGLVFGLTLCWSGMSSPDVIRGALQFEHSYLFLFFASAVGTAALGVALLRRGERRALLVDTPLAWTRDSPARRHIIGSLLFGIGWGVADACPGPIATQIGQGVGWAAFTLVGAVAGVYLFLRRSLPETEPAVDIKSSPSAAMTPAGG